MGLSEEQRAQPKLRPSQGLFRTPNLDRRHGLGLLPVVGAFSEDSTDGQLVGAVGVFVEIAVDFDGIVAVAFTDLAAAKRWR